MQVSNITNQNNNLYFQGKGKLKKLTNPMIKAVSTQDSVILTNKSNGVELEVKTFSKEYINKFQANLQNVVKNLKLGK